MLKDKVVIITGATKGIGFATAQLFLDNGAKVAICGLKSEVANNESAVADLKEKHPNSDVMLLCPNLLDYNDVEIAWNNVNEKFGKVDILINNAGMAAYDPIEYYDLEKFKNIMDLNVIGVFNGCKAITSIFKEEGGGCIINTSSVVSQNGQASGVGYPTSKFAVNGMTKSLARELGKFNIRVNAVAPGVTRTSMMKSVPPEKIKMIESTIPLGRIAEPIEIAKAFLFLASDLASYVSGTILYVDGATVV